MTNWKIGNVTSVKQMFYGCENLISVKLPNLVSSSTTDISFMFYDCSSLTSLDLSGWDTSKITSTTYMFFNVSELSQLHMDYCSSSTVTKILNVINDRSSTTSGTLYVTDSVYTSVKS